MTLTRSFGSSLSGSTSDSLPTHSATTFLVPSSELSKCWNSTSLYYMCVRVEWDSEMTAIINQ